MTRRWMITGVGVGAAVALILALAGRGGDFRPPKTVTVSFGPPAAAPRPRPAGEAEATELAATSSAPSTEPVVERGVALALRIRDDICRCETRECWRRTGATFRGTGGRAVSKIPEESKVIEAARRETNACIKRISMAEDRAAAALEATHDAPEGG
ncbi:hypothetical protein [Sorangium sp. So ce145]|uniref:hypothetical protein n=1 Tax=Sorangium sp. So ce145 TaxID=3133285 RepID=UPI003F601F86